MSRRTPRGLRRAATAGIVGGLLVVGLAACAPTSDYDPDAAEAMQERVLATTVAAASADHSTALSNLKLLETELQDALARGQMTQARCDSVMAAIALVREELEAAIAAQDAVVAPEPTAEPVPEPAPAPAPAPVPEAPATEEPSNQGPGSNNGNGNGNSGNSNSGNNGNGNSGNSGNNGRGNG